jgi:hypothetical protein
MTNIEIEGQHFGCLFVYIILRSEILERCNKVSVPLAVRVGCGGLLVHCSTGLRDVSEDAF